jgi:hypothetical protein
MEVSKVSLLLPCECAEKHQYSEHFGALRLVQQQIGVTRRTDECALHYTRTCYFFSYTTGSRLMS